jgi:hypothetical protein
MYKNYSLKTKNVKDEMVKMKNKEKKKGGFSVTQISNIFLSVPPLLDILN